MKIQVIVGSTRPGRITDRLALWVANQAKKIEGATVEIVDLADYKLPFFDEPASPQYADRRKLNPETKKWLSKVSEADAYVLVTPEYNRSTSGVLKNALDLLDYQFEKKPVALVGHGSSGAAQAIGHLRGILPGVLAVSVPRATFFVAPVAQSIDKDGKLSEEIESRPFGPHTAIKQTLADLKWYADTLATGRASS